MHLELHYVPLPQLLDRTFESNSESQREKDHRRRVSGACVRYSARGRHPLAAFRSCPTTYGGTAKHYYDLNARKMVWKIAHLGWHCVPFIHLDLRGYMDLGVNSAIPELRLFFSQINKDVKGVE